MLKNNYETLYIIGNGFDLHHGMKTKFSDFGDTLGNFHNVHKYLYYSNDDLWANFEENLTNLNTYDFLEHCYNYIGGSDEPNPYYPVEIEANSILKSLTADLQNEFKVWIRGLEVPSRSEVPMNKIINLDPSALFLNFNYTNTLEKVYFIPAKNILHIHGESASNISPPILGHCIYELSHEEEKELKEHFPEQSKNAPPNLSADDLEAWREHQESQYNPVADALESIIRSFYTENIKQTDSIIGLNQQFFNSISNINEVVVMGHSMGSVDMPYYEEIIKNLNSKKVSWKISAYNSNDRQDLRKQLNTLSIKEPDFEFFSMSC